jgi:hypothetical protein
MKTVAFKDNALAERGTGTALYNYAFYNEKLLGNKSIILYDKLREDQNNLEVVQKFKDKFPVYGIEDFEEGDRILRSHDCNYLFIIEGGDQTKMANGSPHQSSFAKTCHQCVFNCDLPRGDVYCSISPSVKGNNGKYPVIPRMIDIDSSIKEDLRGKLNIPDTATVFGGYGGKGQFDIPIARAAVDLIARQRPDIYFLFANFPRFCEEAPNIIHLPTIIDVKEKVKFINTTDAMLWARSDGETFGQAIGEFSSMNKPVICCNPHSDRAHLDILKEKAIMYYDIDSLVKILVGFQKNEMAKKDWNAYREFSPDKVMEKFNNVFLNHER